MSRTIQAAGEAIELLDRDQCQDIAERVHALRAHWTARSKAAPFFTLGAASYLDASPPAFDQQYRAKAAEYNPILWQHFKPLYACFRQRLSQHLGEPVFYDTALALPGFHVFLADPTWGRAVASIHADRQYQNIDWSGYENEGALDDSRQLSITLSIDLPSAGAGLRLWEVNSRQVPELSPEQRKATLQAHRKPHYLPYRCGCAVIHSGHQFHQIAPMPDMADGEQRLTLQAHALPTAQGWVVYW